MVRLVTAADTLIELYRAVVLAVLTSDTRHAWKRERIIRVLTIHKLVDLPVNVPVLRLALGDLIRRGDIARVTDGWYRAQWPPAEDGPGQR